MKKYENFVSNLSVLSRAGQEDLNNEFIISGIIDKFFVQFELGWKVLKELLKYEGRHAAQFGSPREIIKDAYAVYDFIDEEEWLMMLKERNNMTHVYDGAEARRLVNTILERYIDVFLHMQTGIEQRYQNILDQI